MPDCNPLTSDCAFMLTPDKWDCRFAACVFFKPLSGFEFFSAPRPNPSPPTCTPKGHTLYRVLRERQPLKLSKKC